MALDIVTDSKRVDRNIRDRKFTDVVLEQNSFIASSPTAFKWLPKHSIEFENQHAYIT